MPAVTRGQAVELLTREVEEKLPAGEVVEVYNELFLSGSRPPEEAAQDRAALVRRVVAHIREGREPEELVDLWNLIFPTHRNVWYDEEDDRIRYSEESEPVPAE